MAKFCPLFSSSTGNSIYIGGGDDSILIDVGMSAKQTENALWNIGVDADCIRNIFITHEHSDHVKGLAMLTKKHRLTVYAQSYTLDILCSNGCINGDYEEMKDTAEICGMTVSPITGGDGNLEFLAWLKRAGQEHIPNLELLVREAHLRK